MHMHIYNRRPLNSKRVKEARETKKKQKTKAERYEPVAAAAALDYISKA